MDPITIIISRHVTAACCAEVNAVMATRNKMACARSGLSPENAGGANLRPRSPGSYDEFRRFFDKFTPNDGRGVKQ